MRIDLEARLLASLRGQADFDRLKAIGIKASSFEHYRSLYDHIVLMLQTIGKVPRLMDLKEMFHLPPTVTRDRKEFDFIIGEVERFHSVSAIQAVLDSTVAESGGDPGILVDNLIKNLGNVRPTASTQLSITDSSMNRRMEHYEVMAHDPGSRGILTGISYFDEKIKIGWKPGELIGVVGRTYIGKSWLLLFFGIAAWQTGKRVLFVSPEMSIEETEARFDGLIMAKNDLVIDVSHLYRGYVPSQQMKEVAERVAASDRWITYACSDEGRFGLGELARLIQQHHPDILIVDGLPLLESGNKRQQMWESIKDLSYGLKRLAVRANVAIIISHQANRSAHNIARPPGLHEISLGDAFAQACDRLLALSRPQQQENILRITVQKFRKGRPHHGGVDFTFEPERGKIHEFVPTDIGELRTDDNGGDSDGSGDEMSLP